MNHPKFCLEDYTCIFTNRENGLAYHLHKILRIHGIRQQKNKGDSLRVLKSVEMIDPNRTTLRFRDSVCGGAPLLLDDVRADIKALGWVECPFGSILTIGNATGKENSNNFSCPIKVISIAGFAEQENPTRSTLSTSPAYQEKEKIQQKRKMNPSRPTSLQTKSKKKVCCPVSSISTAGSESCDTDMGNLSVLISTTTAGQNNIMQQPSKKQKAVC